MAAQLHKCANEKRESFAWLGRPKTSTPSASSRRDHHFGTSMDPLRRWLWQLQCETTTAGGSAARARRSGGKYGRNRGEEAANVAFVEKTTKCLHLRTNFERSSVASGDRDAGLTAACEQWQRSEGESGPAGYCGMPWLPPTVIRPVACIPAME